MRALVIGVPSGHRRALAGSRTRQQNAVGARFVREKLSLFWRWVEGHRAKFTPMRLRRLRSPIDANATPPQIIIVQNWTEELERRQGRK